MDELLLEYADSAGLALHLDRERGLVRGVKVLGLESRNGRFYEFEAIARARDLYEGAKVNINHPKGNPTAPRDYQDRIGVLRNVLISEAGLFADLHYNPQHALAGQLEWDAVHAPENVGLSHNVTARTSQRENRTVVEAITRVLSVDLVADPATTRGLYEQLDAPNVAAPEWRSWTLEQLRERRGDLVAALLQESQVEAARLTTEIAVLRRLLEAARATGSPASSEQRRVELAKQTPQTTADFVRAVTRDAAFR